MEEKKISEEELALIKEAVKAGAKEGAESAMRGVRVGGGLFASLFGRILTIVVLVSVALAALNSINPFSNLKQQLGFGKDLEDHDLTLRNNGIFGYKAADFAEAVLGQQDQLVKMEVMSQRVTDIMTQTDAGFFKLKVFEKSQVVTYTGTAIYTVDLSKITEQDFVVDEDAKTVTIYIPEVELDTINVAPEDIQCGEVERGVLSFGTIQNTQEENIQLMEGAIEKMRTKLEEDNVIEDAEEFAELSVYKLFEPMVKSVSSGYSLVIEIAD